ncbi:hypothetical protein D3C78_891630 [compost metagenome]
MGQHRRQPWLTAQFGHLPAARSEFIAVINGPQPLQQPAGCRQRRFRWPVEPGQLPDVMTAPLQQLKPKTGEIALQNFRFGMLCRPFCLLFGKQMPADTRLQTPGTACTLDH